MLIVANYTGMQMFNIENVSIFQLYRQEITNGIAGSE